MNIMKSTDNNGHDIFINLVVPIFKFDD